uniref:Protein FAM180B n=1 Tax=Salvator merianae TaxID=96440 RepID=A0A8D0BGG1_SALMN
PELNLFFLRIFYHKTWWHHQCKWSFLRSYPKKTKQRRNSTFLVTFQSAKSKTCYINTARNCLTHTFLLVIFQLLWEGIEIMANETIKVKDEELASFRATKRLLRIFQYEIPKTPAGIEEHLDHLSQLDTPVTAEEFEQLIFTMVYCTYQIRSIQGLEKNLWINLFSQLVTEIIRDLYFPYLFCNSLIYWYKGTSGIIRHRLDIKSLLCILAFAVAAE